MHLIMLFDIIKKSQFNFVFLGTSKPCIPRGLNAMGTKKLND